MFYKIKLLGNGKIMVNNNYLWELETFIQALWDRNKEFNITLERKYEGE